MELNKCECAIVQFIPAINDAFIVKIVIWRKCISAALQLQSFFVIIERRRVYRHLTDTIHYH